MTLIFDSDNNRGQANSFEVDDSLVPEFRKRDLVSLILVPGSIALAVKRREDDLSDVASMCAYGAAYVFEATRMAVYFTGAVLAYNNI